MVVPRPEFLRLPRCLAMPHLTARSPVPPGKLAAPSVMRMIPRLEPGRPYLLRYAVAATTGSPRSVRLPNSRQLTVLTIWLLGFSEPSAFW